MTEVEKPSQWNKIKENWGPITTAGGVVVALLVAYATLFVQGQITAAGHPVSSTSFSELRLDVEVAANDAAHNKETLDRVDDALIRLEGKFDALTLLILEQRN